jgi:hypothetical protein
VLKKKRVESIIHVLVVWVRVTVVLRSAGDCGYCAVCVVSLVWADLQGKWSCTVLAFSAR